MKTMINWFSLPSSNFKRAVKFYNNIFNIDMVLSKDAEGHELAYFIDPTQDSINGGISANPNSKPGIDGTTVYLNAEGKLDDILSKVTESGGQIAVPKTNVGETGFIAMIMDTEGNLVGLHSFSG